jgi:hypothetical protein
VAPCSLQAARQNSIYSITWSARVSIDWGMARAQCLGSLEIDYKLVLRGRLDRKIGRLLTPQDAVDVTCGTPVLIDAIRSIRYEPTVLRVVTVGVDCRQSMQSRQ